MLSHKKSSQSSLILWRDNLVKNNILYVSHQLWMKTIYVTQLCAEFFPVKFMCHHHERYVQCVSVQDSPQTAEQWHCTVCSKITFQTSQLQLIIRYWIDKIADVTKGPPSQKILGRILVNEIDRKLDSTVGCPACECWKPVIISIAVNLRQTSVQEG